MFFLSIIQLCLQPCLKTIVLIFWFHLMHFRLTVPRKLWPSLSFFLDSDCTSEDIFSEHFICTTPNTHTHTNLLPTCSQFDMKVFRWNLLTNCPPSVMGWIFCFAVFILSSFRPRFPGPIRTRLILWACCCNPGSHSASSLDHSCGRCMDFCSWFRSPFTRICCHKMGVATQISAVLFYFT